MKLSQTTHADVSTSSLGRLLRPRSIALIGASATPGSLGEGVLSNLERAHFAGAIYLVNPKRAEIRGRACVASIDALPEGIDCAVLAIPRDGVLDAAAACAQRKVGSLIIFAAGFAESGEPGRAEQEKLAQIARHHRMVIQGPNCLGMVNYVDGVPLTFVVTQTEAAFQWPGVAVVSQSGAMAAVLGVNLHHHGLQISYSVSTGNEAANGVEDFVEHLLEDERTSILTMVVEQFRQPRRFLELAARARTLGKYIVLLHPGSSSAARASAATHTGAMAPNYQVMRTKVFHAGVVLVDTLEELVDVTHLLVRCPSLPRRGAAILTESGAFKAVALDLCERIGLNLPELSGTAAASLQSVLPDFIPATNPLDITAQALVDSDLYRRTIPALLNEDRFGSLVLGIILTDEVTSNLKFPPILDALRTLRPTKPVIFASLDEGARVPPGYVEQLRILGVPFFPSPERALRALARLTDFAAHESRRKPESSAVKPSVLVGDGVLPEYQSKLVLAALGIPIPKGALARTLEEAKAIAAQIGFPIALKAQAADLPHKSDAGGVVLGLSDEAALAAGWLRLEQSVHAAKPELVLDGVLVERMGRPGIELIVGAENDPDWGPVLLVGFGGVLAEALQDVKLLPPELSVEAIIGELHTLKSGVLLRGFRSSPALDVRAAAEIVHALGSLVRANPAIQEIDINPVVVYPEGMGAVALDALIVSNP
jgi:acyl-CoA synthetase (NDP forming)